MDKTLTLATENDTLTFAAGLAQMVRDGTVIFLQGSLGAGKTTFARGFLRGLGYTGKVKSPTYTLVEPYELSGRHLYHFDLYRLHTSDELKQLGIEEYFTPQSICLIEWPDKGAPLLPTPDVVCELAMAGEGREVRVTACSEKGKKLVGRLE